MPPESKNYLLTRFWCRARLVWKSIWSARCASIQGLSSHWLAEKMNIPLPTKIFFNPFVISKDCFQSCLFRVKFQFFLIFPKANLSPISYWLVLPHSARLSQPLAPPFSRFASPQPSSVLAPIFLQPGPNLAPTSRNLQIILGDLFNGATRSILECIWKAPLFLATSLSPGHQAPFLRGGVLGTTFLQKGLLGRSRKGFRD